MNKFHFDAKNFFLGVGALFVALVVPVISEPFVKILDSVRTTIGSKTN